MKTITQDISSNLTIFLFKITLWLMILPWCLRNGGIKNLYTKRFWLHASRGFLSVSAALCLFYGIKHIALTDATAIGYLEQVILVIIGITYFKERSSKSKFVAITFSFIGAFIVIYPQILDFDHQSFKPDFFYEGGLKSFNKHYIFVFLSVFFFAANSTVIKVLGKTDTLKVQLFYNLLISWIIALPLAILNWQPLEGYSFPIVPVGFIEFSQTGLKLKQLPLIILLACVFFTHSMSFMKSLKIAEMSVVMPVFYTNIVFAAILGYWGFDEKLHIESIVGYLLIVVAGIILVKSENRRRKKLKQLESRIN